MRTTTTMSRQPRPAVPQALTMLTGPSLLLTGFVLHPDDTGSPAEVLQNISTHHAQWVAAHLVLFAAAVMLIPAVIVLGRLVTGPQRRVAAVATGLLVFASVGLGGAAAFEQLLGIAATLPGDSSAMARLIERADESIAVTGTLLPPQLAVVLGFLAMAWALGRSRTVPTWAAVIMALGAVGVLAPEPARCIAAALLLTSFVVALRSSKRASGIMPAEAATHDAAPVPA